MKIGILRYKNIIKSFDFCLILSIVLFYAFLSSPTPDRVSFPEFVIGISFVILLGTFSLFFIGGFFFYENMIRVIPVYVWLSYIYLLFFPSLYGLFIKGNSIKNFVRDFIPLLYFFMPLFLVSKLYKYKDFWVGIFPWLISVIGVAFSVRFFLVSGSSPFQIGRGYISDNLFYFPMDPSVLFSATFLLLESIRRFTMFGITNLKEMSICFVFFVGGLMCFLALAGFLVRAQIFLVFFSFLIYLLYLLRKSPGKIFLLFSFIVVLVVHLMGNQFLSLFLLLIEKFKTVGINARNLEFRAIMQEFFNSILFMLFGTGWGGVINNPVVAGMKVRYVHNLYLYFIFKTGLIGFGVTAIYIIYIVKRYVILLKKFKQSVVYLLPLGNVFIVYSFLEAGFKSLSFGLILTYLFLLAIKFEENQRWRNWIYRSLF